MTPDAVHLPDEIAVINIGLPLFADAVRDQGKPVQQLDWRIPAGGDAGVVAALERLYSSRSESIDRANAEALHRLDQGVPMLIGVATAGMRQSSCCTGVPWSRTASANNGRPMLITPISSGR